MRNQAEVPKGNQVMKSAKGFRVISRRISCSTSVKGKQIKTEEQEHERKHILMKPGITRNKLVSVAVSFALTQLVCAGTNGGGLNLGNMPFAQAQGARTFNLLLNGANQNSLHSTKKALETSTAAKTAAAREARMRVPFELPAPKAVGSFISFDAPGAVFGTYPAGITPSGVIAGAFYDENFVGHGFLRSRSGSITTFDVPNAVNGTYPSGINTAGVVMGTFADENFVGHGFLLAVNGSITTFDVPGAFEGFFFLTGINPSGVVVGTLFDENFVTHGFVRGRDGAITMVDFPGADNGTKAVGINPAGVITGIYTDASFVSHGFLRASDGTLTSFDPPSPGYMEPFAPFSFGPQLSITPQGVITGTYFEPIPGNPFGGNFRVFVRATNDTFTTFDAATYPPCCIWSFPSAVNAAGVITGSFNDGFTINHGFVRAADGSITTFDVPGAGTGFNQGTAPLGITPEGVIMGLYIDGNYGVHGFLGIP
jgi:hypothetical protein